MTKESMMNKVQDTKLPTDSVLHDRISSTDFIDCYVVESTLPSREAAEIIVQFPGWARILLNVRKVVTAPFGLLNDGPPSEDKVGPFPVELDTEKELVAGFDDKHLNFRVSVISQAGKVYLATWVHPHNIGGRLYLFGIFPFHIMIARDALKRVALQG